MPNKHNLEPEQEQATVTPEPEQEETAGAAQEAEPETPPEEPKKKKSKETELEEQIIQLNDNLLRTLAEYDNYRKRSQREKEAIYPQATASVIAQFAPVIDTFETALSGPCADEEFKKGIEMIMVQFRQVLEKLGVEQFGAPGDQFNPDLHNAVLHVEDDVHEPNSIVDVYRRGYKLGDRIICHAMVTVAN